MTDKIILIISPQQWGDMKLSKHHYAIELAKHNKVYFLNPPNIGFFKIELTTHSTVNNLTIVNYSDWKLRSFKNRLDLVYNHGFKILFKKILHIINKKIDLIINFDNGVYFRYVVNTHESINLFFPVDKIIDMKINEKNVDIVFSISKDILNEVRISSNKKYLLNHGLNNKFSINAEYLLSTGFHGKEDETYNVAYVGNLLIESLDRDSLINMISQNPTVKFHLFGNYMHSKRINSSLNILSTNDKEFIEKLNFFVNVKLYGPVDTSQLVHYLNTMDIFLLLYKESKGYVMDNSHKLIEYLSFGKPIISTPLNRYKNSDLLFMYELGLQTPSLLLKNIINNYENAYSEEKFNKRILYALDNTYVKNINQISIELEKLWK